jgi:hypothetical protein
MPAARTAALLACKFQRDATAAELELQWLEHEQQPSLLVTVAPMILGAARRRQLRPSSSPRSL